MDLKPDPQRKSKVEAARAALTLLPHSGVLGLGSGTTAAIFVEELAALVRAGRQLRGVATSHGTRELAESLGIPMLDDDQVSRVDVCIDGADELTESLSAIKGGGGAHTREKIVNRAAGFNIIIVDESKLVNRLGERWPVPVEVLPFLHEATLSHLQKLGKPVLRLARDGSRTIFRTDSGNLVYDVRIEPFENPQVVDDALRRIPGVVETGIFHEMIDLALVAGPTGVRRIQRTLGTARATELRH